MTRKDKVAPTTYFVLLLFQSTKKQTHTARIRQLMKMEYPTPRKYMSSKDVIKHPSTLPIVLSAVALPVASLLRVSWSAVLSSNGTVCPRKNTNGDIISRLNRNRWIRGLPK